MWYSKWGQAKTGAVIDQLPTMLDQILQHAGLLIVRRPGLQAITMMKEDIEQVV